MTVGEDREMAIAFGESWRLLLKSCKITVLLCAIPVVGAGWWHLTDAANPSMLRWLVLLVTEGCTAYVVLLWFALKSPPRSLQVYGGTLLGLNSAALIVGRGLAVKQPDIPTPLLALACMVPLVVLILTEAERDSFLESWSGVRGNLGEPLPVEGTDYLLINEGN